MAGYIRPTPLPLSRPLTQIFNDNKRLYEELVQTRGGSPDASPLFLKLRIQKDRLIAWGIQWADRSKEDDIDGALGRAGINDLVASIMDSIKYLLEEAENLNPAAANAPDMGEKARGKMAVTHHSAESVQRLEEINRDLTTSIDTLCDLSRTRLEPREEARLHEKALKVRVGQYVDDKARAIARESEAEASAALARQAARPDLSNSNDLTGMTFMDSTLFQAAPQSRPTNDAPPTYEAIASGSENRSTAIFSDPRSSAGQGASSMPVLLDYRRAEGLQNLQPDHSRYERLLLALLKSPAGQSDEYSGFLKLSGWTLDQARQRYAFVYQLPEARRRPHEPLEMPQPRSLLSFLQNGGDQESQNVPCLEHRFRLATNVALSLSHLHELGISHGNVNSNNIVFFLRPELAASQDRVWKTGLIRKPYLTGFHHLGYLSSAADRDSPLNSICYPPSVQVGRDHAFDLAHDMYGLGLLLLEIGLWMPVGRFYKSKYTREDFRTRLQNIYLKKLSGKVGKSYMDAVLYCLTAGDVKGTDMSPAEASTRIAKVFQEKVLDVLQRCCLMDRDETPTPLKDLISTAPSQTQDSVFSAPPTSATETQESETAIEPQPTKTTTTSKQQAEDPSLSQCITVWSHDIPSLYTNYWQQNMYPKLEKILRRAISRWETYSIDMFMAGADEETARPTVYMECTSTKKVRRILQHLNKELRLFDIRVVPGQIVRSKARKMKSAKRPQSVAEDFQDPNPHFQEKPQSGASIGAYLRGSHLPPVSFGGTVLVDGEPYGMSVHHMLEDEEETQLDLENVVNLQRSMAHRSDSVSSLHRTTSNLSLLTSTVNDDASSIAETEYNSEDGGYDPEHMYPFTIDDAPLYDDPLDVDDGDDDFWLDPDFDADAMEDDIGEEGDTTGITVGDGADLFVTQPALDDVGSDFFPSEEDKDLEHLCSHAFGHVHASSGLRRAQHEDLIHEIDWALIRINDHRLADPHDTIPPIPGQRAPTPTEKSQLDGKNISLIPSANLANRAVHCHGRTSGFATGTILPAMRLVRMPGRVSPSHSWQVRGKFGPGGDSGAWVIDSKTGGVCGHVLAYSESSGVAYIAPMEVMMEDMQRVLGKRVRLPGQIEAAPQDTTILGEKPTNFIGRKPLSAQTTDATKVDGLNMTSQPMVHANMVRSASTRTTSVKSVYMENCQVIGDGRLQASC